MNEKQNNLNVEQSSSFNFVSDIFCAHSKTSHLISFLETSHFPVMPQAMYVLFHYLFPLPVFKNKQYCKFTHIAGFFCVGYLAVSDN